MGITPTQIVKASKSFMGDIPGKKAGEKFYAGPRIKDIAADPIVQYMNEKALKKAIEKSKQNMEKAAEELDFIKATGYRDEMYELEKMLKAR
jgi:excinuclease ABC subunit B